MWDLAVREEDYAATDSMLQRFAGAPLSYRILPAYARRDSAAIARLVVEARNLDARQSQIAARYLATYLGDFATAESLARLDLQPRRNPAIRAGAQSFLAWLELARGRWPQARTAFAEAETLDGGEGAHLERALAATIPVVTVPRAEVTAIRTEMLAWQPSVPPTAASLQAALMPHLRLYLIGLLSSRLGDYTDALARAREMDLLPGPADGVGVAQALAATVRADVAMKQGRAREAMNHLGAVSGQIPLELVVVRPFVNARQLTGEHARFLRAEALMALGRSADSRRWLRTAFQGSPLEMVYQPAVNQRLR